MCSYEHLWWSRHRRALSGAGLVPATPGPPSPRRQLLLGSWPVSWAAPASGVQKALRSLERDGIVAARSMGRTRVYRIGPRYFAFDALRSYLARLTEPETDLRRRVTVALAVGDALDGGARV